MSESTLKKKKPQICQRSCFGFGVTLPPTLHSYMWGFGDGTCGLRKKQRKTWLDVEQMKTPTPDPGCSLSPEENQEFLLSPVGLGPGNLPGKDGSLRKTDTRNTKLVSGGLCIRMEMH